MYKMEVVSLVGHGMIDQSLASWVIWSLLKSTMEINAMPA